MHTPFELGEQGGVLLEFVREHGVPPPEWHVGQHRVDHPGPNRQSCRVGMQQRDAPRQPGAAEVLARVGQLLPVGVRALQIPRTRIMAAGRAAESSRATTREPQ